jgi:hypothetical protein
MPLTNLNIGAAPNDGTGETLRSGGAKINTNYTFTVTTDTDQTITGAKTFTAAVAVPLAVSRSDNAGTAFSVTNINTGNSARSEVQVISDAAQGQLIAASAANAGLSFGARGSTAVFRTTSADSAGGIAIMARNSAGIITLHSGGDTERMRIAANGTIQLPSGSLGIKFGTRNANLNDYEEGTFTPTVIGTTTAGVGTYTAQNGYYTKIGNLVYFHIYIVVTSHTGTGLIRVSGLPFTAANKAQAFSIGSVRYGNLTLPANTIQIASVVVVNSTLLGFDASRDNNTATGVVIDTAWDAYITGTYQTT